MNTDERLRELEKKVDYLIEQTEEKNQNKNSVKKMLLTALVVVSAIFIFLLILGLISFYTID